MHGILISYPPFELNPLPHAKHTTCCPSGSLTQCVKPLPIAFSIFYSDECHSECMKSYFPINSCLQFYPSRPSTKLEQMNSYTPVFIYISYSSARLSKVELTEKIANIMKYIIYLYALWIIKMWMSQFVLNKKGYVSLYISEWNNKFFQ